MWFYVGSGKSCEEASTTLGEERSRNGRARVLARQGGRTADGAEPSTAGRTASTRLASSAGRTASTAMAVCAARPTESGLLPRASRSAT